MFLLFISILWHLCIEIYCRHNCFEALKNAVAVASYTMAKTNIPELRHFLYKAKNISQVKYNSYDITCL